MTDNIYGERTSSHMQKFHSIIEGNEIFNDAWGLTREKEIKVKFIIDFLQKIFPFSDVKYRMDVKTVQTYFPFTVGNKDVWFAINNFKPYTSGQTAEGNVYKEDYYKNPSNVTRFADGPWNRKLNGQQTYVISIDRPTNKEGNLVVKDRLWSITDTTEMHSSTGKNGDKDKEVGKTVYLRQWEYTSISTDGLLIKENKSRTSHLGTEIKIICFKEEFIEQYEDEIRDFLKLRINFNAEFKEYLKKKYELEGEEKFEEKLQMVRNTKVHAIFRNALMNEVKFQRTDYYDMLSLYKRTDDKNETKGIVVASHIVKYSDDSITVQEAGSSSNGLILPSPYDSLFDKGLISFDPTNGKIVQSNWIKNQPIVDKMDLENVKIHEIFLTKERITYLERHLDEFYNNKYNITV